MKIRRWKIFSDLWLRRCAGKCDIYFIKWQLLKMYMVVTCVYWHIVYMTSLVCSYFIIIEIVYKFDFLESRAVL